LSAEAVNYQVGKGVRIPALLDALAHPSPQDALGTAVVSDLAHVADADTRLRDHPRTGGGPLSAARGGITPSSPRAAPPRTIRTVEVNEMTSDAASYVLADEVDA
jgi:hypothetical protein